MQGFSFFFSNFQCFVVDTEAFAVNYMVSCQFEVCHFKSLGY